MEGGMKIINYLVSIILLLFCSWLLWLFASSLQTADPSVQAGIIGILGVVIAGIISHYQTKKREINSRHFSEKRECYQEIINLMFEMLFANYLGKEELEDAELAKRIIPFKKNLMVWGSADSINAFHSYLDKCGKPQNNNELFAGVEKLLREIRKDLGHDDKNLKDFSLIRLVLNDEAKKSLFSRKVH